jgi:hypothetical protein
MGWGLSRHSVQAAAIVGLLLTAWLAGCTTTAGSSTTLGPHDAAGAAQPSHAVSAGQSSDASASNNTAEKQTVDAAAEPQSYYLEFRARAGPVFHTYMVYGPLDATERPIEENFVGFHPRGGALGLALGSAPVPVPGQLNKVWSDEHLPVLMSYRTRLGPAEYRNMVAFIERERKKTKFWNLWVYNCNSFAAEVAWAAGLQAPAFPAVIPPIYVAALEAMNEGRPMPSELTTGAASWIPPSGNERPSLSH